MPRHLPTLVTSLLALLFATLWLQERPSPTARAREAVPADALRIPQATQRRAGVRHRADTDPRAPAQAGVPAGSLASMTATWTLASTDAPEAVASTRFVRTPERIVRHDPSGDRWTLLRNPLDPRHFDALRLVHEQELLLDHEPADLLDMGWPLNWEEAARPMGRLEDYGSLRDTGERRRAFQLEFARHAPLDDSPALQEVWWNEEHRLALEVRWNRPGKVLVQRLTQLAWEADDAHLFELERLSEAGHVRMDLADWREESHGAPGHDHHDHHAH